MSDSEDDSRPKTIGVILFEGFETLDVYGPLGLLTSGGEQAHYVAVMIGPPDSRSNFVLSSSKLPTPFSQTLQWPHKEKYDILLIPGGLGNRSLLNDYEFLYALGQVANEIVERGGTILCVCTGSILLAATGVLSGYDATTNKAAFTELTPEYDEVNWVRKARWIHNNEIITSSGITAGMVALATLFTDYRMLRCI